MTPFVAEYMMRRRLKRIGFTSSFDDLPYIKAEMFTMIDSKVEILQEKERKKKNGNRRSN